MARSLAGCTQRGGARLDGSTFDRLARAVGASGSRRRVLGVLAGLGLAGALAGQHAAAEKPHERLRRRKQ
ncbi:MAG: hypothetical protein U0Z70_14360 [Thermomicrobiales bacterium]